MTSFKRTMRILIIEDDSNLARGLQTFLHDEGLVADRAGNGEDGLACVTQREYGLIILDVGLPDMDGVDVCRQLRDRDVQIPIMMLTSRNETPDKVRGLDSGADDYLTKPFEIEELLARLRSLPRRRESNRHPVLAVADLTLDPATREVKRAGRTIDLVGRQFCLLELLMRNHGCLVTREEIASHVWGLDHVPDRI